MTFHVVRERRGRQLLVMVRMLTDRLRLGRVPGLSVAKVLGTGRGHDTGPSADLRRQAYLLVWDDEDAARRFLASHPIPRRWASADVQHGLALRLVAGHGTWSGRRILDGVAAAEPDGEIVVLTRARIRIGSWRAFRRASRRTAAAFERAPGLRWVIGVGELPVGLLGTVSCWSSAAALDTFLATDEAHATAAARADEWFVESLFARFAPTDLSAWNREPPGSRQTDRPEREPGRQD